MKKTTRRIDFRFLGKMLLMSLIALFLTNEKTVFAEESIEAIEFIVSGEVGDEGVEPVFSQLLGEFVEAENWYVYRAYYDDENDEDIEVTEQLPAGTRITFRCRIPFGSPNLTPAEESSAHYLGGSLFVTVEGTEIQDWQANGGFGVEIGSQHIYLIEGTQQFGGGTLFVGFDEEIQPTVSPALVPLSNPNADIVETVTLEFDPPSFSEIPCDQFVCEYSVFTLANHLLQNPTFTQNIVYGDPVFGLGDVNKDCVVNLLDVELFVDRVSNGVYQVEADINQDGFVNLLDIEPFIDLVSG